MRFLFFLFFAVYAFSYELYVYKKSDYLTLKNIGIVCQKNPKGYICAKSNDLEKLQKIKNYISHFGVSTDIVADGEIKKTPLSGYCIQVLSSKKLTPLEKTFNKLYQFPYARIEKIGDFFVIRVAQEESIKKLKPILKEVKKEFNSAFIRKCDYIPQRIIKNNFVSEKKEEKKENFSNLSPKEKLKLMKDYYYKGEYEKALKLAKDLKRSLYRKESLKIIGKSFYKMGEYEKACRLLKNLNDIYDEEDIRNYKNKACYEYLLNKASTQIYLSPYSAINLIKEAGKFNKDERYDKFLALSYVNIREYKKAYPILKGLYYKNPNNKAVYLNYAKVLFALGEFEELDKIANDEYSFFRNYKEYKKAKKLYDEGKYDDAYKIAKNIWKIYPDDRNINILMAKILNKQKRPDYAFIYLNKILEIYGEDIETLKLMRDIYFDQQDFVNTYKTALKLKNYNVTDAKNNKIFQEYYLLKSFEAYKRGDFNKSLEFISTAEKFLDNIDIFDMRGEVYLALKEYKKAYKNYYDAYLMEPNLRFQKKILYLLFKLNRLESAQNFAFGADDRRVVDYYYIQYAEYYLDRGDYIKANIILSNVKDKKNFEFYETKGIVCFYLNNLDCALNYLNKSFKSVRRDYYLIKTYIKLGRKEKAKELLKSFPKIYEPDWKNKIANLYIELGDIKKAKEILGD